MRGIHPFDLQGPEEDYFVFLPLLMCFILVVPFPDAPWLWAYADFERNFPPRQQRDLIEYHRRAIQRHLYFHRKHGGNGAARRFLSKNASFAPLARHLLERYPDAGFICSLRGPERVISSQCSALAPALATLHGRLDEPAFYGKLAQVILRYFESLLTALVETPRDKVAVLPHRALAVCPGRTVAAAYRVLRLRLSSEFAAELRRQDASGPWRSPHRHRLDERLPALDDLRRKMGELEARFDFDAEELFVPSRRAGEARPATGGRP